MRTDGHAFRSIPMASVTFVSWCRRGSGINLMALQKGHLRPVLAGTNWAPRCGSRVSKFTRLLELLFKTKVSILLDQSVCSSGSWRPFPQAQSCVLQARPDRRCTVLPPCASATRACSAVACKMLAARNLRVITAFEPIRTVVRACSEAT